MTNKPKIKSMPGLAYIGRNRNRIFRRAADHIILWIYAHNKKSQPYLRKWNFYYLENDMVPESRHFKIIKKAYTDPITNQMQADRMRKELIDLCGRFGMDIVEVKWSEVLKTSSENWAKASDKTKYYLDW